MFVLCERCHNHYDDECQSNKCHGSGWSAAHRDGISTSHYMTKPNTAAADHIIQTCRARGAEPREPGRRPVSGTG